MALFYSFIGICSIFLCLYGSDVRRESPTIFSQSSKAFQELMRCVIPSASPVSASGCAGWEVPPQKDILAAAMMPGPPQHAPPLLSVWLWCLTLVSPRMSSPTQGKLTSAGVVCGRVLSVTSHKEPWPRGDGKGPLYSTSSLLLSWQNIPSLQKRHQSVVYLLFLPPLLC